MNSTRKFCHQVEIYRSALGLVIATAIGIPSLSISPAIATPAPKHYDNTVKPSHPSKFHRSPWSWQHWDPRIAPIQSSPDGKTYSQWAAKWWKWALKIPADNHPLNSGDCSIGQKGKVWFLGGSAGSTDKPIKRHCQVPEGTKLFFPLVNSSWLAFPIGDPPDPIDEPSLRSSVCKTLPETVEVSIDGIPVKRPTQYFEESSVFEAYLPSNDIAGVQDSQIPDGRIVGVDIGYYIFLQPLHPGKHMIKWKVPKSSCTPVQEITYNITVKPRR
jgi:hypothetical protein